VRLLRDQDGRSTPNTSIIRQSDYCKVEKVVQANENAGVRKKRLFKESAWLTKPGLKRQAKVVSKKENEGSRVVDEANNE
jgi:hypothetical protein